MVRDLDDFLGGARSVGELCELMEKFLARCQEGGVYLNPTKFNIALKGESVIFAGIKVSDEGYSMDPARLDAIRNFPIPKTNKGLQRWLGLCTSLGQFASSPLKDRLPLQRELLRKNYSNQLPWNEEQVREFETARRILSDSSQMIRPFDPELTMGLVVDTAKTTGLGYILFQFDPSLPPATEVPEGRASRAGPMNFALQGAWSVGAKGSRADGQFFLLVRENLQRLLYHKFAN